MQTELAKLDGNRVELRIEIPAEEVGKALAKAYQRVSGRVRIPGFRKGHAPQALIDRFVGRQAVLEDAFDGLFPETYVQALKDAKIEPIDQPDVSDLVLEEGKPCTFKVTVEVMPEVKLGQYRGLSAVKAVVPVTDADVDQVLAHLRDRQAELVVSDEAKLENGLHAVIDFDGFIDGEPFAGGAGRDVQIELGAGRFLPEFETGLVGAAKGETREVKLAFPADYHAKHLAGQEATFKITVKEIKERKLPDLDDEFAKDVSAFATLEELKADIRRTVAAEREKAQKEAVENQLITKAAENATVDIPEKLIERRVESKLADMVERLKQSGYTLEEYLGDERTEEDLRRDVRAAAEVELKTRLVVEAVVKAEGIQVGADEALGKLKELAEGDEDRAQELRKRLISEGRMEDFMGRLAAERAVNLLVEAAEIKEEVTPTEPEKDKSDKPKGKGRAKAKPTSEADAPAETPKPRARRKTAAKEDEA